MVTASGCVLVQPTRTAAAIVSNVLGKEHPRILMPFNPDMLTLHDIFLDTDIKQVSDQEFEQTLHNALTDNEKHEIFLQLLNLYAQVEKIVEREDSWEFR